MTLIGEDEGGMKMEIEGEKAVMVPASTMGLLLAMASTTKWETENSAWLVAAVTSYVNARCRKRAASLHCSVLCFGDTSPW